jgi:hypothetical protein
VGESTMERLATAPGEGGAATGGGGGPTRGSGRPSPVVPAGRFAWLLFGGLLAVLFIGAGAANAAGWLARHTQVQDTTYHHAVSRIVLDGGSGNLDLSPGPAGEVAVHRHLTWSWRKPVIQESWNGGTLTLKYRCVSIDFGPGCGVDYRLRVPAGADVRVTSDSGDIRVGGLTGALVLSTGSGNVNVSDPHGALTLRTGSGDVNATGIASTRVSARTGSGDVRLYFDAAPQEVTVHTGSGNATALVPGHGTYRVTTDTGSGGVQVRVANDPAAAATISMDTGSGNITVGYH